MHYFHFLATTIKLKNNYNQFYFASILTSRTTDTSLVSLLRKQTNQDDINYSWKKCCHCNARQLLTFRLEQVEKLNEAKRYQSSGSSNSSRSSCSSSLTSWNSNLTESISVRPNVADQSCIMPHSTCRKCKSHLERATQSHNNKATTDNAHTHACIALVKAFFCAQTKSMLAYNVKKKYKCKKKINKKK